MCEMFLLAYGFGGWISGSFRTGRSVCDIVRDLDVDLLRRWLDGELRLIDLLVNPISSICLYIQRRQLVSDKLRTVHIANKFRELQTSFEERHFPPTRHSTTRSQIDHCWSGTVVLRSIGRTHNKKYRDHTRVVQMARGSRRSSVVGRHFSGSAVSVSTGRPPRSRPHGANFSIRSRLC